MLFSFPNVLLFLAGTIIAISTGKKIFRQFLYTSMTTNSDLDFTHAWIKKECFGFGVRAEYRTM